MFSLRNQLAQFWKFSVWGIHFLPRGANATHMHSAESGVCMPAIHQHCIETAEWIGLLFGAKASLGISYIVFKGIWVSPQTMILASGTLFQTLADSTVIHHGTLTIARLPHWASCFIGRPFIKRFALCYRTVVCLSCPLDPVLSVTLVYYGQTVGWIKMPRHLVRR